MIKLRIEDMAESGQGLARNDGVVCFVNRAVIGDLVEAEILEKKKNYYVCEAVNLLEASVFRKPEFQSLSLSKFGLDLLPLRYEKELEIKEKSVLVALRKAKINGFENIRFNSIISPDENTRYRNKAVFPFRFAGGKNICGSFERGSHNVDENTDNISMPSAYSLILNTVLSLLAEYKIKCYDEECHRGSLRYLTIRSNYRGEHFLIFTVKDDELPPSERIAEKLAYHGVIVVGMIKNIKSARGNTPYGERQELIYGRDRFEDRLGSAKYTLSPDSFFQVSRNGAEKLFDEVYRLFSAREALSMWDVYAGVGAIGIYLKVKQREAGKSDFDVWGIEAVGQAVDNANYNVKQNGLTRAEYELGKAEEVFPRRLKYKAPPEVVVVDPPRKGLDRSLISAIVKSSPDRIIYVSCKAGTLARDLAIFSENGYRVEEVSPVNLFPMTMHVECVVLMSRQKE